MELREITLLASEATTRDRLLDAAEALFSEKGIRGASMREITGRASANLAAINYHFGSKEELLREIVMRRARVLFDERIKLLDRAEEAAGGQAPTVSAIVQAFVGPMFRHFGQDPTPADLMRQRAPRVYAWVARMWEAASIPGAPELVSAIDGPLAALLVEACETHLVQLRENALAHGQGLTQFGQDIQGCRYQGLPVGS